MSLDPRLLRIGRDVRQHPQTAALSYTGVCIFVIFHICNSISLLDYFTIMPAMSFRKHISIVRRKLSATRKLVRIVRMLNEIECCIA